MSKKQVKKTAVKGQAGPELTLEPTGKTLVGDVAVSGSAEDILEAVNVIEEVPEVAVEADDTDYIKVKNNTKYFYVQRSTGLRINSGETKALLRDGWLEAEIKSGLFTLVG